MRCREVVHPVKSYEVCDGVKNSAGNSIKYGGNLFIFRMAGVIQMA